MEPLTVSSIRVKDYKGKTKTEVTETDIANMVTANLPLGFMVDKAQREISSVTGCTQSL